jgi:hypothetical protein
VGGRQRSTPSPTQAEKPPNASSTDSRPQARVRLFGHPRSRLDQDLSYVAPPKLIHRTRLTERRRAAPGCRGRADRFQDVLEVVATVVAVAHAVIFARGSDHPDPHLNPACRTQVPSMASAASPNGRKSTPRGALTLGSHLHFHHQFAVHPIVPFRVGRVLCRLVLTAPGEA